MPCLCRGKLSTRMDCEMGCRAPPPMPCRMRHTISTLTPALNQHGQAGGQSAQHGTDREQCHTSHVETLAADQRREPSAERQHDGVGDQVRSQHPGGLIYRGRETARDVRQRYVGDAGIQHFHERRQHHRQSDDPRIDSDTWIAAVWHGGYARYLELLLVIMVAFTFMPGRSTTPSGNESKTIFTGMRSTTLTKFPVAFSGGSRLMRAPVPPAMESTFPAMVRPYMSTSISAARPGCTLASCVSLKLAVTHTSFNGMIAIRA